MNLQVCQTKLSRKPHKQTTQALTPNTSPKPQSLHLDPQTLNPTNLSKAVTIIIVKKIFLYIYIYIYIYIIIIIIIIIIAIISTMSYQLIHALKP